MCKHAKGMLHLRMCLTHMTNAFIDHFATTVSILDKRTHRCVCGIQFCCHRTASTNEQIPKSTALPRTMTFALPFISNRIESFEKSRTGSMSNRASPSRYLFLVSLKTTSRRRLVRDESFRFPYLDVQTTPMMAIFFFLINRYLLAHRHLST